METDLYNILSSFAGFLYFYSVERLQETIPKFTLRAMLLFITLMISIVIFAVEIHIYGINHLTLDDTTGVFGWIYSVPPYIAIIFVVATVGWLIGEFNKRQVSNVLFLEPLMGQYIAVHVIKIDVSPPLISLVGGTSSLIGMYILRETYGRDIKPRTPRQIKIEEKEDELEVDKLKTYYPQKSL